jgi:hypothetical protein
MNESTFKKNMAGAKTLSGLSESNDAAFWSGYQRGLRRNYHGEKLGTEVEHELWLSAARSKDPSRRIAGKGYAVGFEGTPIGEAIEILKKYNAASSLGRSVSEKKSTSSAENGKKGGRPRLKR